MQPSYEPQAQPTEDQINLLMVLRMFKKGNVVLDPLDFGYIYDPDGEAFFVRKNVLDVLRTHRYLQSHTRVLSCGENHTDGYTSKRHTHIALWYTLSRAGVGTLYKLETAIGHWLPTT